MKKHASLLALAAALTATSAFAADLPSRKAEPYIASPPVVSWTGFYAGLNAGYAFGTSSSPVTTGVPVADNAAAWDEDDSGSSLGLALANSGRANVNQSGFVGGGQIGYNYQFNPILVLGAEFDLQGTGIRGQGSSQGIGVDNTIFEGAPFLQRTTLGGTEVSGGIDWFGTLRGRAGYLFTPTLLTYVTGGLIFGGVHAHANSAFTNAYTSPDLSHQDASGGISGNRSSTNAGWTIGGGFEWLFQPNWSLKAEALYYDLGSLNVQTFAIAGNNDYTPITAVGTTTRVNYQGVIARVGVNYHVNWFAPAPVLAKY
jgi:outer membrane immunogenic protein